MFPAFSRGYGGFRELREAGRKHFHLSWYLLVPVVRSYGQKPWGGNFFVRVRFVKRRRRLSLAQISEIFFDDLLPVECYF